MNRAIFLDRDGVINEDVSVNSDEEVSSVNQITIYPEVNEFLQTASKKGYKIIVVTNQSKVGRGIITIEELKKINDFIHELTGKHIHQFYFCPHKREDNCECRKPNIGMIKEAAKDHSIDLKNSWMIGDKTIDIKAGKNARMKTILVKTGYGGRDNEYNVKPGYIVENLTEAGKIIFNS